MTSLTSAGNHSSTDKNRHDLWHELMDFYVHEAWLLDERKFHEWLDLFTDDVFYFMPRRLNVARQDRQKEFSRPGEMGIFEEDKKNLLARVVRLDTGMAWAEDPPSRTRHIVSNLVIEPQENGEVQTRTAFLIYKSHLETDQNLYSGYREDLLRRTEKGWQIAKRTIILDANVVLSKNLSVFF